MLRQRVSEPTDRQASRRPQTVKVRRILLSQSRKVTRAEAVHAEKLSDEIGLLKVAMFPGVIGIDVAKDIDRGIESLDG